MSSAIQPGGISIAWFRIGDLRIEDHEPLHQAVSSEPAALIPFFCLDDNLLLQPAHDSLAGLGLPLTGPYRLAALLHAVKSLQNSLQALHSDLFCSSGSTSEALRHLITTLVLNSPSPSHLNLFYYPSVDPNFQQIDNIVVDAFLEAANAHSIKANVYPTPLGAANYFLYNPQNIAAAFPAEETASPLEAAFSLLESKPTMTEFRQAIQSSVLVQRPLPSLASLPPLPQGLDCKRAVWGENPLERMEHGSWRELYAAAGAAEPLSKLETLIGHLVDNDGLMNLYRGGSVESFSNSAVQRPPIGESEVQERLKVLLRSNSNNNAESGADAGEEGRDKSTETSSFMDNYRESRMMTGDSTNTSAMLSTALSLGTVSPRYLYWKTLESMTTGLNINDAEQWRWSEPTKASPGHHWLLMHLAIRDFFIYWALANRKSVLVLNSESSTAAAVAENQKGTTSASTVTPNSSWSRDTSVLSTWVQGQTGFPFIDASMRELSTTGWMSNRGRQNVASFLCKSLNMDWRLGAEIFQSLEIDFDYLINLGNWAYVAGIGADPRDRIFRTITQGERYDPNGHYIAAWVPELAALEPALRHRPWEGAAAAADGVSEKKTIRCYPEPMIDPKTQIAKGPPPGVKSKKK